MTTHNFNIIGLSGKSGTGKDFVVQNHLLKYKYFPFSFAWHFKVWLVGKGLATYEEVFVTKPPHVRKLLQEEGTERGRMLYGDDIWTNTAMTWFKVLHDNCGITNFVIPDVRFYSEINFIKNNGGKVFRMHAPQRASNNTLTPEARLHISETELDNCTDFDGYIFNDPEHTQPLAEQVLEVIVMAPLRSEPLRPRYSLT